MPDDTDLIEAVRSRLREHGLTHGWYIRSAEAVSSAYEQEDDRGAMEEFIERRARVAQQRQPQPG